MHQINIPEWAWQLGARNRIATIEAPRTALLVVDLQNVFMAEGQPLANVYARDIVPNVNRMAAAARHAGSLVVFLRHTISDAEPYRMTEWQKRMSHWVDGKEIPLRPHQSGHALYPELDVQPQDLIVDKHRFSPFKANSSALHEMLTARGIDTVIVCGTVTNVCCESTARDAEMLGYRVFFIMDATAALSDEQHNASLMSMASVFADVRSTADMLDLYGASARA
ncbi:MAG: cysteine hydrolase [Steroidobacteraceae bacterium]